MASLIPVAMFQVQVLGQTKLLHGEALGQGGAAGNSNKKFE